MSDQEFEFEDVPAFNAGLTPPKKAVHLKQNHQFEEPQGAQPNKLKFLFCFVIIFFFKSIF